jgi:hypothetical protein
MNTQALTIVERYMPLIMVCCIAFGVIQCFFGLRFWKIILGLAGFLVGFAGCGIALQLAGAAYGVSIISGIVAGATVAFLFCTLPRFGTFLVAASVFGTAAFSVAQMLIPQTKFAKGDAVVLVLILAVVAALVGAISTLVSKERGIINVSALAGAWSIVGGLSVFLSARGLTVAEKPSVLLVSIVVLSFLGAIVQHRAANHELWPRATDLKIPRVPRLTHINLDFLKALDSPGASKMGGWGIIFAICFVLIFGLYGCLKWEDRKLHRPSPVAEERATSSQKSVQSVQSQSTSTDTKRVDDGQINVNQFQDKETFSPQNWGDYAKIYRLLPVEMPDEMRLLDAAEIPDNVARDGVTDNPFFINRIMFSGHLDPLGKDMSDHIQLWGAFFGDKRREKPYWYMEQFVGLGVTNLPQIMLRHGEDERDTNLSELLDGIQRKWCADFVLASFRRGGDLIVFSLWTPYDRENDIGKRLAMRNQFLKEWGNTPQGNDTRAAKLHHLLAAYKARLGLQTRGGWLEEKFGPLNDSKIGRGTLSNRSPSKDEVLHLYSVFFAAIRANSAEKARNLCWKAEAGGFPTSRDWTRISDQWRHLDKHTGLSVTNITKKGNSWEVDATLRMNVYPLPMQSQGLSSGMDVAIGTCKPQQVSESVRWHVTWDGDKLKFTKPFKNGLY